MAQVLALPRYAVLRCKYNLAYLSYRPTDKYLPLKGDDILSPKSKFAIEPTNIGNGLVHLRCCYNNRYFVKNLSGFLVANATKPNEDTSSVKCTLFEPIIVDDKGDNPTVRFRHVQSGNYACLYYTLTDPILDACLCATSSTPQEQLLDAYEVIDWATLVRFPSHTIAFKGPNGKYLRDTGFFGFLTFVEDDKNKKTAAFRVEPAGDGSVYIYSENCRKYFVSTSSFMLSASADKPINHPSMLFWPIKLGGNAIALRSSSNNKFLECVTGKDSALLSASADTITKDTHMTVEELIVSREIFNVAYRLDDARVYDEAPFICGYGEGTNDSDQQDTLEIPIKCKEVKKTSWNNSASVGVTVSTTFKTGVPIIAEGEIDIDVSANYEHQWGGEQDESIERGVNYTAIIGPRTHVRVDYVASKGTCDVPFSYTESVTYDDGTHKRYLMDDGLFTGVNCYNYSFVKKETPIR